MDIKNKKIIFIDLDGTLINPKSKNTFPQGVWDMEFNFNVFNQLKKLQPAAIFIISNQGGISLEIVSKNYFVAKFMYVIASLQEYISYKDTFTLVAGQFCESNDKENEFRKPNIGMLNALLTQFSEKICREINKEDCLMIGDMDSDKETANNFQIDYIDVKDFEKLNIENSTYKILDKEFNIVKDFLSKEEVENFDKKDEYTWAPSRWIEPNLKEMRKKEEEQEKDNKKLGKVRKFTLKK